MGSRQALSAHGEATQPRAGKRRNRGGEAEHAPGTEYVIDGLHDAEPGHTGDRYLSGDYPTPGGIHMVNRAFANFFQGRTMAR